MPEFTYMSAESYAKASAELEELKTTKRRQIAKEIAEAREKGDLSENAEYHAAKEAQGLLEAKINDMEKSLVNIKIMETDEIDTSRASILTDVKIKNIKNGAVMTYKLVAPPESNLKEKKISIESPIGKGLLGKVIGEKAKIQTPAGEIEFEILDISA